MRRSISVGQVTTIELSPCKSACPLIDFSLLDLQKEDLSPVSQNSDSRIWCKILKNQTNGMPDSFDVTSYLAFHWLDFLGYCIISWNLNFVKPDSDPIRLKAQAIQHFSSNEGPTFTFTDRCSTEGRLGCAFTCGRDSPFPYCNAGLHFHIWEPPVLSKQVMRSYIWFFSDRYPKWPFGTHSICTHLHHILGDDCLNPDKQSFLSYS